MVRFYTGPFHDSRCLGYAQCNAGSDIAGSDEGAAALPLASAGAESTCTIQSNELTHEEQELLDVIASDSFLLPMDAEETGIGMLYCSGLLNIIHAVVTTRRRDARRLNPLLPPEDADNVPAPAGFSYSSDEMIPASASSSVAMATTPLSLDTQPQAGHQTAKTLLDALSLNPILPSPCSTATPMSWMLPDIRLMANDLPSLVAGPVGLNMQRRHSVDSWLTADMELLRPTPTVAGAMATQPADWPITGKRRSHLPPLLPKPEEPPTEMLGQLALGHKKTGYAHGAISVPMANSALHTWRACLRIHRRPRRATQPITIEPVRTCTNCHSTHTPGGIWRRGLANELLCNRCGLYAVHHQWHPRPVHK